jgi:hypothetical protein
MWLLVEGAALLEAPSIDPHKQWVYPYSFQSEVFVFSAYGANFCERNGQRCGVLAVDIKGYQGNASPCVNRPGQVHLRKLKLAGNWPNRASALANDAHFRGDLSQHENLCTESFLVFAPCLLLRSPLFSSNLHDSDDDPLPIVGDDS